MEEKQTGKRLNSIILLFILVIIILAIVLIGITLIDDNYHRNSTEGMLPEEILVEFNERINNEDIVGVADMTTFRFHSEFEDTDFSNLGEPLQREVYDIQVKYLNDMNQSEMNIINETLSNIELEYDIPVEDSCLIWFIQSTEFPGVGTEISSEYHVCVKSYSNWYIYAPPYDGS